MSQRMQNRLWAIIITASTIAVIVINALANILPFNGYNTGVLSDMIPNLFVPAGLTFAIWGVIYGLLIWHSIQCIISAFRSKVRHSGDWVSAMGPAYLIVAIANMGWILAWHWRLIPLSLGIMLVILIGLLVWYRKSRLFSAELPRFKPVRLAMRFPVSVYLGWISVATVANVTAFLVSTGFDGGVLAVPITIATLGAILLIGTLVIFKQRDLGYTLVLIWALIGIAIKRLSSINISAPANEQLVGWVALGIALILTIQFFIAELVYRRK